MSRQIKRTFAKVRLTVIKVGLEGRVEVLGRHVE